MTDIPELRLQAFSIRDKIANLFMPPFYMPNRGMAVRAFGEDCKNPQANFHKFPDDFELYHIGAYDEESGTLYSLPVAKRDLIARSSDYKQV